MIGFIRSTAAIPYGYIRRQHPAVHDVIADPDVRVTPPDPIARAMALPGWYGPPSDEPPIELREAGWPVRVRYELEDLADLTRVHGSWKAAQLMNWRR